MMLFLRIDNGTGSNEARVAPVDDAVGPTVGSGG